MAKTATSFYRRSKDEGARAGYQVVKGVCERKEL